MESGPCAAGAVQRGGAAGAHAEPGAGEHDRLEPVPQVTHPRPRPHPRVLFAGALFKGNTQDPTGLIYCPLHGKRKVVFDQIQGGWTIGLCNPWQSPFRACNLALVPCRPMAGLISRWLPWAQIVAVQRCAPPPSFLRGTPYPCCCHLQCPAVLHLHAW